MPEKFDPLFDGKNHESSTKNQVNRRTLSIKWKVKLLHFSSSLINKQKFKHVKGRFNQVMLRLYDHNKLSWVTHRVFLQVLFVNIFFISESQQVVGEKIKSEATPLETHIILHAPICTRWACHALDKGSMTWPRKLWLKDRINHIP